MNKDIRERENLKREDACKREREEMNRKTNKGGKGEEDFTSHTKREKKCMQEREKETER
jgi:hypothetical protein